MIDDRKAISKNPSRKRLPQHLTTLKQQEEEEEEIDPGPSAIQVQLLIHQKQQQDARLRIDTLLRNMEVASMNGRLLMINLSRRGLTWTDAHAIREATVRNPHLAVLKLSYNDLGDKGTAIIAAGFVMQQQQQVNHNELSPEVNKCSSLMASNGGKHPSLTVLDLGFNAMGDAGCATLALHAVAGNYKLDTLYLSGNQIKQKGAMAVAGAILHGCNITTLHLSANFIGQVGMQALARAVAEREALVARSGHAGADNQEHKTMQKLHLGGIEMGHEGFVTLSSMLLTNFSIRVLCLSNNGIDDNGMALLAQSLSRNKKVPLEVVQLSFNEISCSGVECFMNATWGSTTLKEIRFDNNKLRDRGAQLAAVVLTSIKLEVVDLSFNKITTVGIKALMKSLSENASLQYLGLSGIPIDPNASKALSYGLAYNSTLRYLHVAHCQIGYAAQRHIIAGVVSNRLAVLRVLTGFNVGAISVTLGLPQALENWTNDQCLSFIRRMWKQWRCENGLANKSQDVQAQAAKRMGPAPPPAVVKASRMAFQVIGLEGAASLNTEDHQKELSETSPLVHTNDTMLERSLSGTLRVPAIAKQDSIQDIEGWVQSLPMVQSILNTSGPKVDLEQKNRNIQWLRSHFQSLHQVGQLPFNEADLWQLHQYFFSPMVPPGEAASADESVKSSLSEPSKAVSAALSDSGNNNGGIAIHEAVQSTVSSLYSSPVPSETGGRMQRSGLNRSKLSFQSLGDAAATSASLSTASSHSRRRTLTTMEGEEDDSSSSSDGEETQPATKRARNYRPRISYYPRIRELLENMGTKQSQHQILSLLRQLKFVESIMFEGRNVYGDDHEIHQTDQSAPADVEMIILDLL
jgi:Ran GTPase-activating protein (RanGAP) involved in mRNA processing and transport